MDTPFVKISEIFDRNYFEALLNPIKRNGYVISPIEEKLVGALQRFGFKGFEREYPIGKYYADIYIPSEKIVVECDGDKFHKNARKDVDRDVFMELKGIKVLRFSGVEIVQDPLLCAFKVLNSLNNFEGNESFKKYFNSFSEPSTNYCACGVEIEIGENFCEDCLQE